MTSLQSYCEFIIELDKCLTCRSEASLVVDYTTASLKTGPGTLAISPDIQFSESLCHFYRNIPFEPEPDADGFLVGI